MLFTCHYSSLFQDISVNTSTPFSQFLKKRFNSTLKPYFFTVFLIYAVSLSFSNMGFQRAFERIIKAFYGSTTYIDWTHLWFLPSLFVTSLFSYWMYRLVLSRLKSILLRWLILLGLLAVGVYSISYFFPFSITVFEKDYELFGLPFNLDLVFVTSFFYILGNEVRQVSSEKFFSNIWLLLVTGAGLVTLPLFYTEGIDLAFRIYPSLAINTAEAILGILFTLALSKQIEMHWSKLFAFFEYIGHASLIIFIFHGPIQEFWGKKILFMTNIPVASTIAGFVVSVSLSLLIYEIFIKQNPVAMFWFGRRPSLPEKTDKKKNLRENLGRFLLTYHPPKPGWSGLMYCNPCMPAQGSLLTSWMVANSPQMTGPNFYAVCSDTKRHRNVCISGCSNDLDEVIPFANFAILIFIFTRHVIG